MNEFKIPKSHPRYKSLIIREKIVKGFKMGIVVPEGLIAHGRGEAFDYILGERTHEFAREAIRATIAYMLLSKRPVISVNGNLAALAGEEVVSLSNVLNVPIEVNLFYRTEDRIKKIEDYLRSLGARKVLGASCEKTRLPGLESPRGIVCVNGIFSADFVLLGIEDGDRTEALKRAGKIVSAIDLNPFSRTAQTADITIVDEATRALKVAIEEAKRLKDADKEFLKEIILKYDNKTILSKAFKTMLERLKRASEEGIIINFSG
jgi:4-phosphopantoate--beta-alanine ligase